MTPEHRHPPGSPMTPELEPLCEELRPYVRRDRWIHHPLIIEMPPWRSQTREINQRLADKKKAVAESWEQKNYLTYLMLHQRPYRFGALEEILAQGGPLTDSEIAQLVTEIWIDSENIHQNRAGWRRVWQSLRDPKLTMDADDTAALAAQPDPLTVFRGVQSARHDKLSLSWTTDRERAVWFARRFPREMESPLLINGQIAKKNIFAYFVRRKESEVVALPKFVKGRKEETI
jgi:hypothetical protein